MRIEDGAKEIGEYLRKWKREHSKLVVAIDGYTGVGKTTLLSELATINSDLLAVNRDDFLFSRKKVEELLNKAEDKSKVFESQVLDVEKVKALIHAFRNNQNVYSTRVYNPISGEIDIKKDFDLTKDILMIEGVFMFHPDLINHLWDKRIYLKGDLEKIDRRRVEREKESWGRDYIEEIRPDSYFRQVVIGLKRYQKDYNPEQIADLVIDLD